MEDTPQDPARDLIEIRKLAEAALVGHKINVHKLTPAKAQSLIHELHVQHVELEMQNEELNRIQAELMEVRDKYADLYDFAPVGYFSLDESGRIHEANLKAADMLGHDRNQLVGMVVPHFIAREDRDLFHQHRRKIFKTHLPHSCELKLMKHDGTAFHVLMESAPVRKVDGNFDRCRTVITDISERKRAEEFLVQARDELEQRVAERTEQLKITYEKLLQAEKLSALGKLSASIAHEFNNPLFGIRSVLAGINRRLVLDETDKELVGMALSECDRIKRLIISLQDFNQPTSGVMAPVDLHQTIDSVLLLAETDLRNKKIKLEKEYCAGRPQILGIADQIKQVFLNLLINAAEGVTGKGGGSVRLATEISNVNQVKVDIRDTGVGIRPENMGHIFEPFFSTKPDVKGTGLGLSVSYGIIKRHGGKIEVQSEPGKGSTFTVILPLETAANG